MKKTEGYIRVAGGSVWYAIYGNGANIPLLIVHGGPGSPHNHLLQLSELADKRPIIFYDQLGSGRSDRPNNDSLWTLERFLTELKQVIDFFSYEKIFLLGHSWGTILAAEYALKQPARLAGLILASPCLSIPRWSMDAADNIGKLPLYFRDLLENYHQRTDDTAEHYDSALIEYYRHYICRLPYLSDELQIVADNSNHKIYQILWGETEFDVSGSLRNYDLTDRLAEIRLPVLFTCGKYDEATPSTTSFYRDLIKNAELAILEDSAHLPHLEEPAKYRSVIDNFLHSIDPNAD